MQMEIYPWQTELWRQLAEGKRQLPHALLLHGRSGIGKLALARTLAQTLLCETPQAAGGACGHCLACGWFAQGNHPDFRVLESEAAQHPESAPEAMDGDRQKGKKPSKYITIEQVRELSGIINLTTHRHGLRIILIHPAEAMNANAANALLKTLEEPPPQTLFILVSHQPQRLLPTVLSRCLKIAMPVPAPEIALKWLQDQGVSNASLCLAQAGYAPLDALSLCNEDYQAQRCSFLSQLSKPTNLDPIALAEQSEKVDLADITDWLRKWVYDLIGYGLTGKIRYQPDFTEELRKLSNSVDLLKLFAYQRELLGVQQTLQHPLNSQLLVEQLLLSYTQALA